jgi:hypothetical protein
MKHVLVVTISLAPLACGSATTVAGPPPVATVDARPAPAPTMEPQAAATPKPPEKASPPDPESKGRDFGMIGLLNAGSPSDPSSPWGQASDKQGDAPRVQAGAVTVAGRLPAEVVRRVVQNGFGPFQRCYEDGLRKSPKLEGKVTVKFVVQPDGSISNVGNGGSDLPDANVVACVVRAFHGMSFPQPEAGKVLVVYPLRFSPAGREPPKQAAPPPPAKKGK